MLEAVQHTEKLKPKNIPKDIGFSGFGIDFLPQQETKQRNNPEELHFLKELNGEYGIEILKEENKKTDVNKEKTNITTTQQKIDMEKDFLSTSKNTIKILPSNGEEESIV